MQSVWNGLVRLLNVVDVWQFNSHRLRIVCWDPCLRQHLPLPVAELPVQQADLNGMFMLQAIDRLMSQGSRYVKCLIFDAATSHQLLRRALFGTLTEEERVTIQNDATLSFFNKLRYDPLPDHGLPRLPISVARFEGRVHCALPGVCD